MIAAQMRPCALIPVRARPFMAAPAPLLRHDDIARTRAVRFVAVECPLCPPQTCKPLQPDRTVPACHLIDKMPPKRAAQDALAETEAVNKRYRQAIDDVADEYVCPITAELPLDPVTAEDGRCYERWAIEEWFAKQPRPQVKSPVTNEPMGKRLLPAVQVRNSLKRLVESGAISGSKADAWKKAMAEEAEVGALRARADGGDASAMDVLGCAYRDGTHGLKKDLTQAFTWLKRSADLKNVHGLTSCGILYLDGRGVERSHIRGFIMLGEAAALGSEHACGVLGLFNAEGLNGLDKDQQEATRWYREMQKCGLRNSVEEYREKAAAWLREHP